MQDICKDEKRIICNLDKQNIFHTITNEDLRKKFKEHDILERNCIDFWQFTNIIKDLDIDTKYMADKIYDQKFGKFSKCICYFCKNFPCRYWRNRNIKDNLIMEKGKLDQDIDFDKLKEKEEME